MPLQDWGKGEVVLDELGQCGVLGRGERKVGKRCFRAGGGQTAGGNVGREQEGAGTWPKCQI